MKKQELEDFRKLCDYIKKEILNYGDDKSFPSFMAQRLKALSCGVYLLKGKESDYKTIYSYKVILVAFVMYKREIDEALFSQHFKNEQHKINYIMKIVERNMNNVVDMIKNRANSKEKLEKSISKDIEEQNSFSKTNYISKTVFNDDKENDNMLSELIEELW